MLLYLVLNILLVGKLISQGVDNENLNINKCIRIESHPKNVTVEYSHLQQDRHNELCFTFPFICTKYKTKTVWANKTETIYVNENITECCVGYEEKNKACLPVCKKDCVHGKCVSPERCLCDEGWEGQDCSQECEFNRYGRDCLEYCSCQNGATCDKTDGRCHCPVGFIGIFCESHCPKGSFGKNCLNKCNCQNGATCEEQEGACLCPPGYIGKFCENKCPDGKHGMECKQNCTCEQLRTEFCSHINGYCNCLPGHRGEKCEKTCPVGFWGTRCANDCNCNPNSTCDYITGNCECPAGRRGINCSEICPINRWGKNCGEKCFCMNKSTCDPESGTCLCLPGWLGKDCSIPCPEGMYGRNCNFLCECHNNGNCNHESGKCTCVRGWTNPVCSAAAKFSDIYYGSFIYIILIVGIVAVGIILFAIIFVYVKRKSKKAKSGTKDIYADDNSTSTVIANDISSEFSSQNFMNPLYGKAAELENTIVKFLDIVSPTVSNSTRSSCRIEKESTSTRESNLSQENNHYANMNVDASQPAINKTDKKKTAFIIGYSKSSVVEDSDFNEENKDAASLYRISIYDDVIYDEGNHYDCPNEVISDKKTMNTI